MKVLVDTCIWSLVFRRDNNLENSFYAREVNELIDDFRVQLIGPIRQELLSGIKSKKQYEELKQYLAAFPDAPIRTSDYELAAELYNICRKKGIQGSSIDFLICSLAIQNDYEIFTIDKDFKYFKKCIPINLYIPKKVI